MKKTKINPKLSKLSFDKETILTLSESYHVGGAHTNTGFLSCVDPTAPAPQPFSRASCELNCVMSVSPYKC